MSRDIRVLPCVLVVLLASTLPLIEQHEPIRRDLDSVELFAGEQQITLNARSIGLNARSFDKRYRCDGGMDLLQHEGFLVALKLVLRLKSGGNLWGAPWCGPWIFVNRAGTGRTRETPAGDVSVGRVRYSNSMVVLTVILYLVAWHRGCHIMNEQPPSSLMIHACHTKCIHISGLLAVARRNQSWCTALTV